MTIKTAFLVLCIALVATCVVTGDDEWFESHLDGPGASLESDLCQGLPVDIFSEGFSDGSNGAWSLSPHDVIEPEGGLPGGFLHAAHLDTFAPVARTQWQCSSMFTGNYRARRAVALGTDFKTFSVSRSAEARPVSLMLVSDADTPEDTSDDIAVYYVGPDNVPLPGGGWVSYQLTVPSRSSILPFPRSHIAGQPGWVAARADIFTPITDPDAVWNAVIEDVDQVMFWFIDPRHFALVQRWDVGMDNPFLATCRVPGVRQPQFGTARPSRTHRCFGRGAEIAGPPEMVLPRTPSRWIRADVRSRSQPARFHTCGRSPFGSGLPRAEPTRQ
jgi:hypothetical protein